MIRGTRQFFVAAMPVEAFAVMADPQSNQHWDPPVIRAEVEPGAMRVGGSFLLYHTRPIGKVRMTIRAYDPPHLYAYHGVTGFVRIDDEFRFEPHLQGCRITVNVTATPLRPTWWSILLLRGFMALMLAMVTPRMRRLIERRATGAPNE